MYIIKRDKAFVCIQESCCSGSVSPTSLAFIGHHAGKDISCARLLPDIVSYVVIPTLLSSISGSDMFRPFTCFTLVEITCFSRTACAFLNVTTFFWGDLSIIASARDLAPVLGGTTREFICHRRVDTGLVGCQGSRVSVGGYGFLGRRSLAAGTSTFVRLPPEAPFLCASLQTMGGKVLFRLFSNVLKVLTLVFFRHGE